ncbi:MAG: EAL domain-containing protein [Eubacterium sp.]|nr:EAL domain-containing protein [Eubacterium sp.]
MLYILLANAASGIVTSLTYEQRLVSDTVFFANKCSRYIYFVSHTALAPIMYFYVASIIGKSMREDRWGTVRKCYLFIFSELMVLLNPVFGWVWYFNSNREFCRNWGEIFIYFSAAVYVAMSLLFIIFRWKVLAKKRKTTLIACFMMVLVGVLLQLLFKSFKVEVLFEAIGFTGAMMSLENEDDRMNASVGVYNRQALGMDVESAIHNYSNLQMVFVRVINKDVVNRITRSTNIAVTDQTVCEYLKTVVPKYSIYLSNPGNIALMLYHKDEKQTDEIVEQIAERFQRTWKIGDNDILLNAVIMRAELPRMVSSVSDALYMADSPLPEELDKVILEEKDLDYLLRRAAVEAAVSRGLDEGSFEVYYQPTYNIDGSIHGAEALLRMNDKELGKLFPDEFIPVAEYTGLIDEIDDFVLREVCSFIRTGKPEELRMECINVNLSVVQCMKQGFTDHIIDIVETEGVEKSFINFEITESVSASDYKLFSRVVKELKNAGFLFSMDDFGTGYSNIAAIFSLNLDVIKIDKSILWNAEKSEAGKIVLENTVRMMKQMRKKILVEGVETKEQIEILEELGVDYLQGFYFSKPVPLKELVEKLA